MASSELAEWIRLVHDSLLPSSIELSGAAWGPIRLRHRSTRTDWFEGFGRAWAKPLTFTSSDVTTSASATSDRAEGSSKNPRASAVEVITIDLVSGSLADLSADITPPAITIGELGARGEILGSIDEGVAMVWGLQSGEILGWDKTSGKAICLRLEPPDGYETVSPLRSLVHWATIAGGGVLLHGASIGRHRTWLDSELGPVQGLLLVGEAGYGKSTSTLSCLERGWVTSGDDAVAIFPSVDGFHATAVYAAVKTKIEPAESPELASSTDHDSTKVTKSTTVSNDTPSVNPSLLAPDVVTWTIAGRKRAHLLTSADDLLVDSIRLAGIVVLDPAADCDAPWQHISAAAARNSAAPSSALPLPYYRSEILNRIGTLVSSMPCFSLPRRAELKHTVSDLSDILDDSEPKVSIIIPVFNGERFIDDALNSIASQSTGLFEIIVVSDASPDDSIDCAEKRRSQLEGLGHALLVIEHETNQGVAQARNTGINASTYDLIAFLDQDDLWSTDHLAVLHTALTASGAQVALGGVSFIDLGGDAPRPWIRDTWFERDHPGHVLGAVLVRHSAFDELGVLESLRPGFDDVDWFMRLRDSDVPFVETSTIVLKRRIHDSNHSQNVPSANHQILSIVRDHIERNR